MGWNVCLSPLALGWFKIQASFSRRLKLRQDHVEVWASQNEEYREFLRRNTQVFRMSKHIQARCKTCVQIIMVQTPLVCAQSIIKPSRSSRSTNAPPLSLHLTIKKIAFGNLKHMRSSETSITFNILAVVTLSLFMKRRKDVESSGLNDSMRKRLNFCGHYWNQMWVSYDGRRL